MSQSRKMLILMLLASLMPVLAFQACTTSLGFSEVASTEKSGGNGDGYNGKPTIYAYYSDSQRCSERGANGKPLANREIFVYPSKLAELVRDACADIVPKRIDDTALGFDTRGRLVYEGSAFDEIKQNEFEVLAASCPAGYQTINGAIRRNFMDAPVDFTTADWVDMDGILTVLDGTMAGLFGYRITRLGTASYENWQRVAQYVEFPADRYYAFSIFAKRGNVNEIRIDLFDQTYVKMQVGGVWDLVTGARLDDWEYGGFSDVSFGSRSFAGGQFLTVYFKVPAQFRGADIGFSPEGDAAGSYIYATSAQLEDVGAFCAPGL